MQTRIFTLLAVVCLTLSFSADAYIRYDLRSGGNVWFENLENDEAQKLRVVFNDQESLGMHGRILVIYDGEETQSYDPYADQQLSGGLTREQAVFQTPFRVAVNAQSLEHASKLLDLVECKGGALFDRIYIVDHGIIQKKGIVQTLGNEVLTPKKLSILDSFLSENGDLCLYGCGVGSNVSYLKKVSDRLDGRKVWAYASSIRYSVNNPQPLQDPESAMFFSYPFY